MGVLICLRESGLVGMGAMFGGDVIQSRFLIFSVVLLLSGRVGMRRTCSAVLRELFIVFGQGHKCYEHNEIAFVFPGCLFLRGR